MTAAEKKLSEKNLDLIFEFERYVLEHPEVSEKIPGNAVVFMKVAGDEKFDRWTECKARMQAGKGVSLISVTVKKCDRFILESKVSPWSTPLELSSAVRRDFFMLSPRMETDGGSAGFRLFIR